RAASRPSDRGSAAARHRARASGRRRCGAAGASGWSRARAWPYPRARPACSGRTARSHGGLPWRGYRTRPSYRCVPSTLACGQCVRAREGTREDSTAHLGRAGIDFSTPMGYFERLWSELPDAAPEHFAIRREFVIGALEPGSRVIDVGCGAGWFCGGLAAAGFSVTGGGVAQEPLRRPRERLPDLDFLLVSGGGELPF